MHEELSRKNEYKVRVIANTAGGAVGASLGLANGPGPDPILDLKLI